MANNVFTFVRVEDWSNVFKYVDPKFIYFYWIEFHRTVDSEDHIMMELLQTAYHPGGYMVKRELHGFSIFTMTDDLELILALDSTTNQMLDFVIRKDRVV